MGSKSVNTCGSPGLFPGMGGYEYAFQFSLSVLMKKYWVGNRRKRYYDEFWGNSIWGRGGYETPVRLSMCDGPIEIEKWDAIMAGGDELWESTNPLQGLTFDGT